LFINHGETVADVKLAILKREGRVKALARVISLTFWTVELDDQREFAQLELPGDGRTTIDVRDSVVETIQVDDQAYEFGASDTVGDLRALITRERGCPVRLTEPDDSRALSEIAIRGIRTVAEEAPAAPVLPVEYQFGFEAAGTALFLKFTATPDTPLTAAEGLVKKRAGGGEGFTVLFQLVNEDTDEREVISSDTPFGEAQRDGWFVSARLVAAPPPIALVEPEPLQARRVSVVSIGRGSVKISAAPIDSVEYAFVVADTDVAFRLSFARGQTVLDARKAVQTRFDIEELADIGLLFGGKALRDNFVLDRLRVGTKQLTVTIRDRRPILLLTAVSRT
jgi:hypothetical protein